MKNPTVQLTVKVAADTAEQIKKLANQNHITIAEQIRRFTDKGLQISGYTQEIDFIAGMIRQELMAVYQLDDIKNLYSQSEIVGYVRDFFAYQEKKPPPC